MSTSSYNVFLLLAFVLSFAAVYVEADGRCDDNFGGCDAINGLCWGNIVEPNTSYCSCKAGFKRDNGQRGKCIDVNECEEGLHDCDTTNGRCANKIGGYTCICKCNYALDYTGTKCLLISKITGMCTKPNSYCLITTTPPRTTTSYYIRRRRWMIRIFSRRRKDSKIDFDQVLDGNELNDEVDMEEDFDRDSNMLRLLSIIEKEQEEEREEEEEEEFDTEEDIEDDHKRKKRSYYTNPLLTCKCEIGYQKNHCGLCQDINECSLGTHSCDDKCVNTDGGYYCLCNTPGKVLGPCGFKCYDTPRRPRTCNSRVGQEFLENNQLAYTKGITTAQLLGTYSHYHSANVVPHKLKNYGRCIQDGKIVVETFSLSSLHNVTLQVTSICQSNTTGGLQWVIQSIVNTKAKWGPWTCWHECKASCSGGVQIRTRRCIDGSPAFAGCPGASIEKKSCYHGPKCALKVRKEARTLTTEEEKDYLQAMKKYTADKYSTYGFHAAAGTHVWPFQCRSALGINEGCCYHGAKLNFVTWHRAEIKNMELGLTRHLKNKNLGVPYWDWLRNQTAPDIIWAKTMYGEPNPFANVEIRLDLQTEPGLQRDAVINPMFMGMAYNRYVDDTYKMMKGRIIHEFSESLELSHNFVHIAACSNENRVACHYSMANLMFSSYDPLFLFHHTNVDRLFAVYQAETEKNKDSTWTRQNALLPGENIYHFNEPFNPYRNATLTPWTSMRRVNSMQDVYHYKELMDYEYDTLEIATSTQINQSLQTSLTEIGRDELYIAQYQRNMGGDVIIRYYYVGTEMPPVTDGCSSLAVGDDRFLGEQLILGTLLENPWVNRQPTLLDMSRFIVMSNLDVRYTHHAVRACATSDINCRTNCSAPTAPNIVQLPAPQQVMLPRFSSSKQFRFNWEDGQILPHWEIDINSETEFVQFTGPERHNVVQFKTEDDFNNCRTAGADSIDCATSVCILKKGVYYFGHKLQNNCNQGMKLRILAKL